MPSSDDQSACANLLTPRLISVYENISVTRVNAVKIVVKSDGNTIFLEIRKFYHYTK